MLKFCVRPVGVYYLLLPNELLFINKWCGVLLWKVVRRSDLEIRFGLFTGDGIAFGVQGWCSRRKDIEVSYKHVIACSSAIEW